VTRLRDEVASASTDGILIVDRNLWQQRGQRSTGILSATGRVRGGEPMGTPCILPREQDSNRQARRPPAPQPRWPCYTIPLRRSSCLPASNSCTRS
jgi:hypothetical protein